MCGRFTQQRPTSELAEIFGAESLVDDPGGHFNLAPTQDAAVVVERGDRRAITGYRWGLIPSWAKNRSIGSRLINARAETIATAPAFRDSFRRHRVLVPADAFYEWDRTGGVRQPYVIHRRDGRPMAFAGVWAFWRDPDTLEPVRTFAIVTTRANDLVAAVHGRMPVILAPDAWDRWLDPKLADPGQLQGLLEPGPDDELDVYPVSRSVNDVRRDGPELVEPIVIS